MLSGFLQELFQSGRVTLPTARPLVAAESAAIDRLKEEEAARRADFPGEAPEFSLDVAYWAAGIFFRACQFFAARDLPESAVRTDLSVACPLSSQDSVAAYSADITFRYLPDLYRLASGLASGDVLVDELRRLADEWPLSGVGIPASEARTANTEGIEAHPGLLCLYVDRVLQSGDHSLFASEAMMSAAKSAVGSHFVDRLQGLIHE